MSYELVIVESPTKARIINKFLGKNYKVESSMGHVRDLPPRKLGIDIKNNFEPTYELLKGKKKVVSKIKKLVKDSSKIYIAMDEDREGEAIGWHMLHALGVSDSDKKVDRIAFHEITEEAIREALQTPRRISMDLVNAQQARRILDRIVGFKVSPLLHKKIAKKLSAGRVQSIGLMLIVDREKEVKKFNPVKYYTIEGSINTESKNVEAKLWGASGKKYKKLEINSADGAKKIIKECLDTPAKIKKIEKKNKKVSPKPPFITSTLQRSAFNRLRFNPAKTMSVAQQLYEGLELSDKNSSGLITYMRTDSFQIAKSAIKASRKYIKENFEDSYLPSSANYYKANKSAQEAHECIRPTDILKLPSDLKGEINQDQYKLYSLIWNKFIASQMTPLKEEKITVKISCKKYEYRAKGRRLLFDGYTKVWEKKYEENIIPELEEGLEFKWDKLLDIEHETKPPPRYTQATLVKELEKNGIGRPSTYASIIRTLFKRKYVSSKKGALVPSEIAEVVVDALKEHFPNIMDKKFTAYMEDKLDEVAKGKKEWKVMLSEFYEKFKKNYDQAVKNMEKLTIKTGKKCPDCGQELVIKWSKFGKFMACSGFPDCKKTFDIDKDNKIIKEKKTDYKCPKCSSEMIIKKGRYGKFLACSAYPKCKNVITLDKEGEIVKIPLGWEKCPDCGKNTLIKKGYRGLFLACSGYPKCKFTMNYEKAQKR
ncbi:MAG: type I DNA topoisomerase [Elusimicrobia bacterium]|jgi:DNA topoisomerase-1|nr:type I DNA topoisomerase [Elusimicrobiota bacterium]